MKPLAGQLARTLAAFGIVVTISPPAFANCWSDGQVEHMARQVAARGFPNAARSLPELLVCEGRDFAPGIGGDYTTGIHRIRIPAWQLQSGNLATVLAHELAHAEVALTYGDAGPGGHGRRFFEALIAAGYTYEAERVAGYVDGGQRELMAARARTGQPTPPGRQAEPPTTWVTICEMVPAPVLVVMPGGQAWVHWQWQRQCRQVQQ